MMDAIRKKTTAPLQQLEGWMMEATRKRRKQKRKLQQPLLPLVHAQSWANDKMGQQQTASKPLQQSISMSPRVAK